MERDLFGHAIGKIRRRSLRRRMRPPSPRKIRRSELIKAFHKGEHDVGKLAERFGIGITTVRRVLRQAGEEKIPRKPQTHCRKCGQPKIFKGRCMNCREASRQKSAMKRLIDGAYREQYKAKRRAAYQRRHVTNPVHRIVHRLRTTLRRVVDKGIVRKSVAREHTLELLGCSLSDFIKYLLRPFPEGTELMELLKTHHLDHIRPCNSFDLTKKRERAKCFHYSNMQLLPAVENIGKGPRYLKQHELFAGNGQSLA
jgi:hypothetical protein